MPQYNISIQLDKPRKVYHQGLTISVFNHLTYNHHKEFLIGKIVIENKYELKHEGILLSVDGSVEIDFNLKSINFMDTFQGAKKSIMLIDYAYEPLKAGKLMPGKMEIPFKLPVDNNVDSSILYETYHGIFISIKYYIRCCLKRPLFFKDVVESIEFFVEYDPNPIGAPPLVKQPFRFEITPNDLSVKARRDLIPNFKIVGQLDSLIYQLDEPISGEFIIEKSDSIIRSVELQLVRVETCGHSPDDRDYSKDPTEVQNIQIGDGDVLRNQPIPIHMILPRLFTCPTLLTRNFRIEFDLNLVIIFDDNYLIRENFSLKLIKSTLQPINLETYGI